MSYRTMKVPAMKTSAGFSLIELLVVLVILGLIAGLVVPNIMGQAEDAKWKAAKSQIQVISNAVDRFYLDNGNAPDSLEDLVRSPGSASNWNGPYVKESALQDPWNVAYHYQYPGDHGSFDIYSYGADKQPGGDDNAKDINSWE